MFERLKQEGETFDELVARLAWQEEPIVVGASRGDRTDRAKWAVEQSRERFRR